MTTKIDLGSRVKCKITGFEGVVIARTEWLSGCTRVTVKPEKLKDGKTIEAETFDEPEVEVIGVHRMVKERQKAAKQEEKQKRGGPRPEPQRQPDVRR